MGIRAKPAGKENEIVRESQGAEAIIVRQYGSKIKTKLSAKTK